MQQLAAEGHRGARHVLDRLNNLDIYIAASQLGITMASLGLGWVGEPALARLIEPAFEELRFLPEGWREGAKHTVAFVIAFSIITALHIVLGEQVPKTLAIRRPEATSLITAGPIHAFLIPFRPVIALLSRASDAVLRLFGIEPTAGHTLVQSAEELKLSIDASREAGLVEQSAHDLVDRAFLFTDLDVRHAMVPRTEMAAIPVEASLDEVLQVAMRTGHLRLPVYEGDTDHIVGIVNVKRLLPLILEERTAHTASEANGAEPRPFDLRDYMTEPVAVPETAPAADVLTQLRETHTQLAVVIDEYGGTAGIVTLVDLVENLVGEIEDELDPVEPEPAVAPDGSFTLDGLTTLVEAKEYSDLDLEEEDVDTVGGYVFSRLGRPAEVGDEVTAPSGQVLRVEEIDGLRVARVRVLPPRRDEEADPGSLDAAGDQPATGNGRPSALGGQRSVPGRP